MTAVREVRGIRASDTENLKGLEYFQLKLCFNKLLLHESLYYEFTTILVEIS